MGSANNQAVDIGSLAPRGVNSGDGTEIGQQGAGPFWVKRVHRRFAMDPVFIYKPAVLIHLLFSLRFAWSVELQD